MFLLIIFYNMANLYIIERQLNNDDAEAMKFRSNPVAMYTQLKVCPKIHVMSIQGTAMDIKLRMGRTAYRKKAHQAPVLKETLIKDMRETRNKSLKRNEPMAR